MRSPNPYDYGPPDVEQPVFVFVRRVNRARKEHKCAHCPDPIRPGEPYEREFFKMEGEKPSIIKHHPGSNGPYSYCPRDLAQAKADYEAEARDWAAQEAEADRIWAKDNERLLKRAKQQFFASNDCPRCLSGRRRCTNPPYTSCPHVIRF